MIRISVIKDTAETESDVGVRIVQDQNASLKKDQQRKTRELRWKAIAKDITQLIPMNGE